MTVLQCIIAICAMSLCFNAAFRLSTISEFLHCFLEEIARGNDRQGNICISAKFCRRRLRLCNLVATSALCSAFDADFILNCLAFPVFVVMIRQEWNKCSSLSFQSLFYYVIISNSTFIYVLLFVVNHAAQEDVLSGIPLVFIFGFFLLIKPLPGPRIIRFLAYYSVFCVVFRKTVRMATTAYSVSQKKFNLTEVPSDFCSQNTDYGSSTFINYLSNSKYVYFTSGSILDVFVIMAIQLHMSVLRSRGLDRYVDQCAFYT
jgi:hypothetical protein